MELLKEVAHIAGKPGLFRIVKPGRSGVIVESLDAKKEKQMVSASAQVSILKDISMYTTDPQVSRPLGEIFMKIKEIHNDNVAVDVKTASKSQLFDFMASIMPDFDSDRVRESDVRKLISWYRILLASLPEIFEAPAATETAEAEVKEA